MADASKDGSGESVPTAVAAATITTPPPSSGENPALTDASKEGSGELVSAAAVAAGITTPPPSPEETPALILGGGEGVASLVPTTLQAQDPGADVKQAVEEIEILAALKQTSVNVKASVVDSPSQTDATTTPDVPAPPQDSRSTQTSALLGKTEPAPEVAEVSVSASPEQTTSQTQTLEPAKESVKSELNDAVTASVESTQDPPKQKDEGKSFGADISNGAVDMANVKTEDDSDNLSTQIKVRDDEIDLLKSRIKNLETELVAALTKPGTKNHEVVERIKEQHEELLTKAKGMIFDKTKMVKSQELQIQALTSQVASLKDVASITKDLLEIRNAEVKHLEERLETMDLRFKAERERHALILKRTENNNKINDDLKSEYEMQLKLFKELREKYEQRVQALVKENERVNELLKAASEAK